jgi:hypothetical protein
MYLCKQKTKQNQPINKNKQTKKPINENKKQTIIKRKKHHSLSDKQLIIR